MNNATLEQILKRLIDSYISDQTIVKELVKEIEPSKVKYILGEIGKNKNKEYSPEDKEDIKDIVFYYC